MQDLIVGFVIFCFIFLGAREGVVKSLASIALIFVSLYLATAAVGILATSAPQFGDPSYAGTIGLFFLAWLVTYIFLDALLMFLFRRVIKIIVLGPVDVAAGILAGGFKGLLISGIVLQLILSMPVSNKTRETIVNSILSRISLSAYQLTYPYVKRLAPILKVKDISKLNLMDRMGKPESRFTERDKASEPDKLLRDVTTYQRKLMEREKSIQKMLKDKQLIPGVPQNDTVGAK